MKKLIFLLMLFPLISVGQKQVPITIEDLSAYVSQPIKDTIGYGYVVHREEGKKDVILQLFKSKYRGLIKQQVNYLPDNYPFTEGSCWDYLKWRFKVYTNLDNKSVPLTGYVEAIPIIQEIPYKKDLSGFLKYIKSKNAE